MAALVVLRQVFVHDDASPVHRSRGITAEGMEREVEGLLDGRAFVEKHVLGGQHSLRGHIVGIHALPATGDGAAMEHYLQTIAVGIAEDVLVELHGLLFVTSKEVDLDAFDANGLHPFHLPFAGNGCVHAVARALGGIVPVAIAVIP